MNKKRKPTFIKFLLSYMVVLFLPFLLVWFLLYSHFEEVQREQLLSSNQSDLQQIKNITEANISDIYTIAAKLTAETELSPYYLRNFYNVYRSQKLMSYATNNEFYHHILYYIRGFDYLLSSQTTYPLPIYYSMYDYKNWDYSEFYSTINEISAPTLRPAEAVLRDHKTTENFITYLIPIPNNVSNPYGTAIFTIREHDIRKLFEPLVKYEGSHMAVLDSKGHIIMSLTEESYFPGGFPPDLYPEANKPLILQRQIEDKELIVTSIRSADTDWTYIHIVPEDVLMAPINELRENTTLLFMLILILGSAIIYLMMYVNYNPVKALAYQFQELNGSFSKQMEYSLPALRQHFTRGLLKGKFNDRAKFNDLAKQAGMNLQKEYYYVLVLQLDVSSGSETRSPHEYAKNWLSTLSPEEEGYYVEMFEHHKITFILSAIDSDSLREYWEERQRMLYERTGVSATIGIGHAYRQLSDLSKSFFEASTALHYKWLKGNNSVILYAEVDPNQLTITWYPKQELEVLAMAIKQDNTKVMLSTVETALENIKKHSSTLFMARFLCYEIVNTIMKTLIAEWPNRMDSIVLPGVLSLTEFETFDKLEQTVMDVCREVCVQMAEFPKEAPVLNKLLDAIYEYLEHSFSSYDFSVQRMAEHLSLSSKYISTYFKEQTGKTVMEYVNELRIEKSKQLLKDTNKQIQDIVPLIGYSDASSFIRKFKQVTGMTPGEYRKLHN